MPSGLRSDLANATILRNEDALLVGSAATEDGSILANTEGFLGAALSDIPVEDEPGEDESDRFCSEGSERHGVRCTSP